MSTRILYDDADGSGVLYDSVTEVPFGILMHGDRAELEEFLAWLPRDARDYRYEDLPGLWRNFQDRE